MTEFTLQSRGEQLQQKPHSLQSLKYLRSGPLQIYMYFSLYIHFPLFKTIHASHFILYFMSNFKHESLFASLEKYFHRNATWGLVENNSRERGEGKKQHKQGARGEFSERKRWIRRAIGNRLYRQREKNRIRIVNIGGNIPTSSQLLPFWHFSLLKNKQTKKLTYQLLFKRFNYL